MLDNMFFNPGGFRSARPSLYYTTNVDVYRKVQTGTTNMRNPVFDWPKLISYWPAAINSKEAKLEILPQGRTDIGTHAINVPWRQLPDGTLVIQEDDILWDPNTKLFYLVIWAHDPMGTREVIIGSVRSGVTAQSLAEQT